ncbi:hypothetical protein [Ammonifex thiophilus]|uniref:Uncharacterized protein n=1 Tax=Ammonifex thiophilus TaxID=444093 RepID=A0A3D8P2R7_9THEO|nr:hypothetical protein [Ammonifex thiophilus]RDV80941.1 hypothetical protein DXX99_10170 [Ammonifex thiophilus]
MTREKAIILLVLLLWSDIGAVIGVGLYLYLHCPQYWVLGTLAVAVLVLLANLAVYLVLWRRART